MCGLTYGLNYELWDYSTMNTELHYHLETFQITKLISHTFAAISGQYFVICALKMSNLAASKGMVKVSNLFCTYNDFQIKIT